MDPQLIEDDDETLEHAPNMLPEDNGLYCFLDRARPCGPDCMSFQAPKELPELSLQQTQCVLLVGVERLGRHTGGALALLKRAQDDRVRETRAVPLQPLRTP